MNILNSYGKIIEYDATNDLQNEIFKPLQDIRLFIDTCMVLNVTVKVSEPLPLNDTLAWYLTGNRDTSKFIDIDPFVLYELPAINHFIA